MERYIVTQAIKTRENEIIPLFDPRIKFDKHGDIGSFIQIEGRYDKYFSTIECLYDIRDKKIEIGIEVNVYPDEKTLTYKKGMVVYHGSNRKLTKSKVVDIIYEDYDLIIKRGRKLDKYDSIHIKDFDRDALYAIKRYEPCYVLEDGFKTKYTHELYTID